MLWNGATKNSDSTKVSSTGPEYIYIKSMYGFTQHIGVKNESNTGSDGLCGYKGIDTSVTATVDLVKSQLPHQHRGFMLCQDCVEDFTGIPADEQREDVRQ